MRQLQIQINLFEEPPGSTTHSEGRGKEGRYLTSRVIYGTLSYDTTQ